MKELSIEEKARCYDEAIERAKEQAIDGYLDAVAVNDIFPELKESEDERMRKAAINACKYMVDNFENSTKQYKDAIAWLENQGEQKSDDKIELKFKVGDWIIFDENHNSIYQVERIDNYRYYLRHYLGGTLSVHFDNELTRPWTIQDAKDGDVLSYRNGQWIFIYKEKIDDSSFYYHALYSTIQGLTIASAGFTLLSDAITPATKEQSDLLFQKMKEAGYIFDFDKKELKKIEQKSAKWSEEDEKMYKKVETAIDSYYAPFSRDAEEMSEWFKNLKDRVLPKQEWSKEDEEILNLIIARLHSHPNVKAEEYGKDYHWFKFLKNRVLPQPKQEWDKEDENNILFLTSIIEEYFKDKEKITLCGDTVCANFTKEEVINRLKSLRPQNKWKPSEEQIKAVKEAACYSSVFSEKTIDNLILLSKQLKKLREA